MHEELTAASADDMLALGRRLAAVLLPGDLVVLSGDLGAGKTTLVQGIGAGLGVRGPVTSPTFVIARVHPSLTGGPALVHADAYRLNSPAEVDDLDLDASLETSVTVVEWGGGLVEGLAPDRLDVSIALAAPGPRPRAGRARPAGPGRITGRIRNRGRYGWRATAPGGKASMASRLPGPGGGRGGGDTGGRHAAGGAQGGRYPPEERPPGRRPRVGADEGPRPFLRFWWETHATGHERWLMILSREPVCVSGPPPWAAGSIVRASSP